MDRLHADKAIFSKDLSIEGTARGTVTLRAELAGPVTVRGEFQQGIVFADATINGTVDLRECDFKQRPSFNGANFGPSSEVDLRGSKIQGVAVQFIGQPSTPRIVHLDGAHITGDVSFKAEFGQPRLQVAARASRPHFEGSVSFTNVDLGECRLVGNDLTKMEFANIRWAKRWWRNILFDEKVTRCDKSIPYSDLKEASQVLKQWYQRMGDHAKAGDFHYSEMEMKRYEYGWPRRGFCLEGIYWLLSGYGVGYVRAGVWLALSVVVFGLGYLCWDPVSCRQDFWSALRFSLQVATLQRPSMPDGFSETGRWLQTFQTVISPVLIALFALAVRMRVKR